MTKGHNYYCKDRCQLFHIQGSNFSLPSRFDCIQSLCRWFLLELICIVKQIESRLLNCCIVLKCAEYELLRSYRNYFTSVSAFPCLNSRLLISIQTVRSTGM